MNPNRLEPVLILLAVMILFFTGLLIWVAKVLPSDGQTFQVVSGLLTGFSGAFLMRVKPLNKKDEDYPTKSTTMTLTEPETEPKEKK